MLDFNLPLHGGRSSAPLVVPSKAARRRVLLICRGAGAEEHLKASLTKCNSFEVVASIKFRSAHVLVTYSGGLCVESTGFTETTFDIVARLGITDIVIEWPTNLADIVSFEDLLLLKLSGVRIIGFLQFIESFGAVPLHPLAATSVISENTYHFDYRWRIVKRLGDIVGSLLLLVASVPLFALSVMAIKATSPGPVFYRQERVGLNGRIFTMMKLRSMRNDAESDGQARFARHDDTRITPIGRVLRKTRIDELPQLINVLKSEMSLVGPRPERPLFVDRFKASIPLYNLRLLVKPGITGWAQIKDPYASSEEETRSKLSRDLFYIKKGSLWMDARILVQTVWVMLACRGSR